MKKRKLGWLGLFVCTHVFAWNATGHRLIAQIAYDQLTRHEKTVLNRYNRAIHDKMANNVVNASVWLDSIRFRTHDYDAMHYIDIPFSTNGLPLPAVSETNAVTAIHHSIDVLQSKKSSEKAKGIALRILVHVVGDIHQPLHTATRVSRDYPDGDHGGNFVPLYKNKVANNLHAYWDKGAGLLIGKRRFGTKWIKMHAKALEKQYPCSLDLANTNVSYWAQESHDIAVRMAYAPALKPDLIQMIVQQRIATAGCRLACILHQVQVAAANDFITAPKNRVASPPVTAR